MTLKVKQQFIVNLETRIIPCSLILEVRTQCCLINLCSLLSRAYCRRVCSWRMESYITRSIHYQLFQTMTQQQYLPLYMVQMHTNQISHTYCRFRFTSKCPGLWLAIGQPAILQFSLVTDGPYSAFQLIKFMVPRGLLLTLLYANLDLPNSSSLLEFQPSTDDTRPTNVFFGVQHIRQSVILNDEPLNVSDLLNQLYFIFYRAYYFPPLSFSIPPSSTVQLCELV